MEDPKFYSSSTDNVSAAPSPYLRARAVPDVPEDVDFLMEHLNDPNYDLKKAVEKHNSSNMELGEKKIHMGYDIDGESHLESDHYSTSRAESRNSTAIEFDE